MPRTCQRKTKKTPAGRPKVEAETNPSADEIRITRPDSDSIHDDEIGSVVDPDVDGEPIEEWIDQRASAQASRAAQARSRSGRRHGVDPTTCERQYSNPEIEFMMAMEDYKRRSGRLFPTWSEVLEVVVGLGYSKEVAPAADPAGSAICKLSEQVSTFEDMPTETPQSAVG